MAGRPDLRAVRPGEVASPPAKPLSISEAIAAGDYLAELEALHRRVSVVVNANSTNPRDLAALVRRQVELSKEIHVLRAAAEDDGDDSLTRAMATSDEVFDPESV